MCEASVRKYQNRAIEAATVIGELIALVKQMREADVSLLCSLRSFAAE